MEASLSYPNLELEQSRWNRRPLPSNRPDRQMVVDLPPGRYYSLRLIFSSANSTQIVFQTLVFLDPRTLASPQIKNGILLNPIHLASIYVRKKIIRKMRSVEE